jgi:hypothetical protein
VKSDRAYWIVGKSATEKSTASKTATNTGQSDIIYSMNELYKDRWGRIEGLCFKTIKGKPGWYYKGEYVASQLREAYRIIKDRIKSEGV